MGTLRGIHRWLDALSERTKIVGLLVALAIGLTLVGGVALVDAREGESAAVQGAWDNGLRLAQSLNDGLSSRTDITSACAGVLSAARASNRGIEATYTSDQAAAFYRGCEDGAPQGDERADGATSEEQERTQSESEPAPTTEASGSPLSGTEAASLGSDEAVLLYAVADPTADTSNGVEVKKVRLKVLREGKLVFGRPVECPRGSCYLADWADRLTVVQLEPGNPHVVVSLWSGGMRCCEVTMIYAVDDPQAEPIEREWPSIGGGAGPTFDYEGLRDVDGDGYSEFVSRDGRFPTYASQAEARSPLQISALRDKEFVDVTRDFSDLLKVDSKQLWAEYAAARTTTKTAFLGGTVNGCLDSCRGFLGTWAAELALLGRWKDALAALQKALRRGELEGDMSEPATGKAYLAQLEAFLKKTGYLNSSVPAHQQEPAPVPTPDELAMDELSSVQTNYESGIGTEFQPAYEAGRVYGQWLWDTQSERPNYLPTYCSALLDQHELTNGRLSYAIRGGFQAGCRRGAYRFMSGPSAQRQTAFDDLTRAQLGHANGLTDGHGEAYVAGRVYGQSLWDTRQGNEVHLASQCRELLYEYKGPYGSLSSAVQTGFREGCSRSIERR